jgi:ATP-binding protein involved in chromosome partitioning
MLILSEQNVRSQLEQVQDPNLQQNLLQSGAIKEISITGNIINIVIQLGYPWLQAAEFLAALIQPHLLALWPQAKLNLTVNQHIRRHLAANGVKSLPQIKNIIAVASGKGGVGKSTVAVNLALALQQQGARVGILDADIYGPSQPHMLGVTIKPIIRDDKSIQPIIIYGLQSMSIGYLINADTPAVWRGPMVSGALQQMLNSTAWYDLDYLIVDLPPGTGDVQLTLAQKIPVCGTVVVTTPQDVALLDVTKAIGMFVRVKVPILGVVENMSVHVCSNCGQQDHIFGSDGGARLASEQQVRLLASIPLERNMREQADLGVPIVIADPTAASSLIFKDLALKVAAELAKTPRNFSVPLTNIVVEET